MQLKGKSACTGYSIGKIAIYDRTETKVVRKKCKDPENYFIGNQAPEIVLDQLKRFDY